MAVLGRILLEQPVICCDLLALEAVGPEPAEDLAGSQHGHRRLPHLSPPSLRANTTYHLAHIALFFHCTPCTHFQLLRCVSTSCLTDARTLYTALLIQRYIPIHCPCLLLRPSTASGIVWGASYPHGLPYDDNVQDCVRWLSLPSVSPRGLSVPSFSAFRRITYFSYSRNN